jgi:hypothetical protein
MRADARKQLADLPDLDFNPPVLFSAFKGRVAFYRVFRAASDRNDIRRCDTMADKVVFDHVGPVF